MNEALGRYIDFLLVQLQYDMHIFSIGWVHWLVFPMAIYFVFFLFKWWMLLVPVTLPMTIWAAKPHVAIKADRVSLPPPSAKN